MTRRARRYGTNDAPSSAPLKVSHSPPALVIPAVPCHSPLKMQVPAPRFSRASPDVGRQGSPPRMDGFSAKRMRPIGTSSLSPVPSRPRLASAGHPGLRPTGLPTIPRAAPRPEDELSPRLPAEVPRPPSAGASMWNPPGVLTTADSVRAACRAITDADPRVFGPGADNITSELRDSVLRRWELMKLVEYLPGGVMQRLSGLDPDTFSRRRPQVVAKFLFARSHSVELSAIRKGRLSLRRLLIYLVEHEIPWEGEFGRLSEIDLFSFLTQVHENAVAKGTDARPGLTAAWSVLEGLAYLKAHFGLDLPTDSVRKVIPKRGHKRGAAATV